MRISIIGVACGALLLSSTAAAEPLFRGELAGHLSGRGHNAFLLDSLGSELDGVNALSSRARVRLEVGSAGANEGLNLRFRLGGDLGAGTWLGGPMLEGDDLPGSERTPGLLTEAFVTLDAGPWLGLKAGLMLSHWGLGLVANAGDDLFDGRVQQRLFESKRTGDRVIRGVLYSKPFASLSESPLRGLVIAGGIDRVEADDTAQISEGDETYQGVASVRLFLSKRSWFGLYYVYRDQETKAGKTLQAHVIDLAGDLTFHPHPAHRLRLQAEFALISGETNFAPSPEHPTHEVLQLGGVARLSWHPDQLPLWVEFDLGYFSGDSNLDDARLTRFVSDRNFQQGLILFPTVLAWQTGRHRISADRPEVMGFPPEDLDRLATDGGVTSALTIYPKVVWTPSPWLDIYGGVLLALANEHIADPYTSRTQGGGAPYNSLGNAPTSPLLGVEFDLGVRAKVDFPEQGIALSAAAEYGTLVPGGALDGMDPVHAFQLSLSLRSVVEVFGDKETP